MSPISLVNNSERLKFISSFPKNCLHVKFCSERKTKYVSGLCADSEMEVTLNGHALQKALMKCRGKQNVKMSPVFVKFGISTRLIGCCPGRLNWQCTPIVCHYLVKMLFRQASINV